jgi:hypothetical protein
MRRLLFAVSGARSEILDRCPTERVKFESLGCAILITSAMATISMWFALDSAMGLNPVVALIAALGWGLIILGIDRWLVTSMPSAGSRRLAIALPRLVLALLLGSLISTPIVLRIFQSEINAQITVIKQQRASAFLATQQNSEVGAQVTYWRNDVSNLEKVIDSNGEAPINPATDPQVEGLTRQRTAELALEQQYYKQWQCQLYGGSGCPKGNGPLAQASENSYHQAVAQVTLLTSQIQQRDNQLSATDAASKQARYQQAVNSLPEAKQQLNTATAREDALQANFDAQNEAVNGLLIRLEALNQLSNKNFTVDSARFLLFLLFLTIECLPVSVKLLQQPGNYERILQAAAERELTDARRAYLNKPRGATVPVTDGVPNKADFDMREIWETDREAASYASTVTGHQRFGPQQPEQAYPEYVDTADHIVLDDNALRRMDDVRLDGNGLRDIDDSHPPTHTDQRGNGLSVRYKRDDL